MINGNPNNHGAAVARRAKKLQSAGDLAGTMLKDGWGKREVKLALVESGVRIRDARAVVKSQKKTRARH